MIWPTFLKDLRLLWPLALLTAALQAFTTWLSLRFYLQQSQPFVLPPLFQQSGIVPMLAAGLLCALLVRQDPPQGERNDWLTRPLPRGRIALTKVAAALVMIHLPILLIDFGFGLAIGIEPVQALFAGFLRSLYIFAIISLPSLGAAALAGTLGQAIVGAVAVSGILFFIDSAVIRSDSYPAFTGGHYSTLAMLALPASAALMGALALGLQFPRRKRATSALAAAPFALFAALMFDPGWTQLFGFDPSPKERPETARFTLAFDAARGPFNHKGDPTLWQVREAMVEARPRNAELYRRIYAPLPGEKVGRIFLPVRSTGTPAGEAWTAAHPSMIIRDRSGAEIYAYYAGFDRPFPQSPDYPEMATGFTNGDRLADDAASDLGLSMSFPAGLLRLHGDEPVSIEAVFDIDFLHKAREAPVKPGRQAVPGFGACTISPPRPGAHSWSVSCLEPRMPPYCITLQTARDTGWSPACSSLYLPFTLGGMMNGPFPRSPQGGGAYADPGVAMLIQDWRPSGHARRTLRIENIKLNDWTTAANEAPLPPGGLPPS